jgi:hypothetical protein
VFCVLISVGSGSCQHSLCSTGLSWSRKATSIARPPCASRQAGKQAQWVTLGVGVEHLYTALCTLPSQRGQMCPDLSSKLRVLCCTVGAAPGRLGCWHPGWRRCLEWWDWARGAGTCAVPCHPCPGPGRGFSPPCVTKLLCMFRVASCATLRELSLLQGWTISSTSMLAVLSVTWVSAHCLLNQIETCWGLTVCFVLHHLRIRSHTICFAILRLGVIASRPYWLAARRLQLSTLTSSRRGPACCEPLYCSITRLSRAVSL